MENKTEKKHSAKYFEVLNMFGLTPNFKLSDYEKDLVKLIDEKGMISALSVADYMDLRPSDAKMLIKALQERNIVSVEDDMVSLTKEAIKYIRATKEERKTEKKFRKFLDALSDDDIDTFVGLVNSFVITKPKEEDGQEEKPVEKETAETTV